MKETGPTNSIRTGKIRSRKEQRIEIVVIWFTRRGWGQGHLNGNLALSLMVSSSCASHIPSLCLLFCTVNSERKGWSCTSERWRRLRGRTWTEWGRSMGRNTCKEVSSIVQRRREEIWNSGHKCMQSVLIADSTDFLNAFQVHYFAQGTGSILLDRSQSFLLHVICRRAGKNINK